MATKTKKSVTKSKRKVKAADKFINSKEVIQEQNKLKELQKSRKKLEAGIKNTIDTYNSRSAINKDAEHFLDKLPLDSLKEFNDFTSGQKHETSLGILKMRSKLRREKETQELELGKIQSQISTSQIDLLLAKINYLVNYKSE